MKMKIMIKKRMKSRIRIKSKKHAKLA